MLQKAELSSQADSENNLGGSSEIKYFIGLDVHKKTISFCVKDAAGRVYQEGKVGATRRDLDGWVRTQPQPRMMAMEATIFTGGIYDHLLPHAEKVKVTHPLMLRAIAAAKKKNDRIDASKIADCLRCDFLPECHMASTEIRDRRRMLRYHKLGRIVAYDIDPTHPIGSWKVAWTACRRKAQVSCRLHDLRHTFVSRLGAAKVADSTLTALSGWMSRKMLERYSHTKNEAKRLAVDLLSPAKMEPHSPQNSPQQEGPQSAVVQ